MAIIDWALDNKMENFVYYPAPVIEVLLLEP